MVPFVGRRQEVAALEALTARARREGTAVAALITGEPGSGKSRLLREAIAHADPGRRVLLVGFEPTQPIPLAAAADLFRRLARVPDHGPRLHDLAFGSTDRTAEGALQVFEAANRALADFGPLVLAIDDLQWVDPQSIALVHYLANASESARRPLAILAASRPSPAARSFSDGILQALGDGRRVSIDLGGLDLHEGVALIRAIGGEQPLAQAADLWRRAGGLPFWIEALARGRAADKAADLIGDRFRGLSADAGSLVNALAVGARPFHRADLVALVGDGAERVESAVRELVGRGLALDDRGHVRLAHDLIREAASQTIPASTARDVHARLADRLEHIAGEDLRLLVEALDHRVAAGQPVVDLAIRLVQSPARCLLEGDAVARLSRIADEQPADAPARLELDQGLGRLAAELADQELAIRHWSRVASSATDPSVRLRAELETAKAGYETLPSPEVHAHLGRARSLEPDAITEVEIDTVEARVLMEVDDRIEAGSALADRTVVTARRLVAEAGGLVRLSPAVRRILLEAFAVASDGAIDEERADDAVTLGGEVRSIADSLDDEGRLVGALHHAHVLWGLRRYPEAADRYREVWDLADRLIRPRAMLEAGIYLVRTYLQLGRQVQAREAIDGVALLRTRIRPWDWEVLVRGHRLIVDLALGERDALRQFDAHAPRLNRHFAIMAHQWVATILARKHGRRAAADVERELADARAAADKVRCAQCDRELQVVSAELLARLGQIDEARSRVEEWDARFTGRSYPMRDLWRARARAAIAVATNDPEAGTALAELGDAFEHEGLTQDAAWAWIDLGRLHQGEGNRRAATQAFERAAIASLEIGSPAMERLARQALREMGVRAWRRGTAHVADAPSNLSDREQEVARLVAAGATNLEVAESLAISPKTVERHLTNILAKVGARNRTELAARFRDAGTGFPR